MFTLNVTDGNLTDEWNWQRLSIIKYQFYVLVRYPGFMVTFFCCHDVQNKNKKNKTKQKRLTSHFSVGGHLPDSAAELTPNVNINKTFKYVAENMLGPG